MSKTVRDVIALAVCVGIAEAAGVLGSLFTVPAIPQWYAGLLKPALTPPAWLFGPVWTLLYLLMGIAAFLVWSSSAKATDGREKREREKAILIFGVQLVINALWSVIFFGFRAPLAGFIAIVSLWLAIVATTVAFEKVCRPAAWLLLPYLFWVSFATYLNFAVWFLNR